MNPKITAVICTFNRVAILAHAMESVSKQSMPESDYEVLVIDNASTDETSEVAAKFCDERRNFKYLFEPVAGLSKARNCGIAEARGRYIAFLDDDAVADKDWLEKILAAFEEGGPMVGCVGGRTLPDWEMPRPKWLHDVHLEALSIINWSDDPFVVELPQFVVGANIAFDRGLVQELGGFNEKLGRVGASLLSGDETELNSRIVSAGRLVYFAPTVSVSHMVSRERLTKSWHLNRAKWQGIGDGIQANERIRIVDGSKLGTVANQVFNFQMIRYLRRALFSFKPNIRFLFQTLLWAKLNFVRTILAGDPVSPTVHDQNAHQQT